MRIIQIIIVLLFSFSFDYKVNANTGCKLNAICGCAKSSNIVNNWGVNLADCGCNTLKCGPCGILTNILTTCKSK